MLCFSYWKYTFLNILGLWPFQFNQKHKTNSGYKHFYFYTFLFFKPISLPFACTKGHKLSLIFSRVAIHPNKRVQLQYTSLKVATSEHRLAQCENPAYTRCYRVCLGCITARTAVCDWASLFQIPFKTTIFADCAFTSVSTRCRREHFVAVT